MKVKLLDLEKQYRSIEKEIDTAVKDVLENGSFIMGPNVKQLEKDIANYTGVKHAIAVANGTDALMICLRALGVGPGDEVITTPYTFFASAETTSVLGATPVFVDIDETTLNINPKELENKITNKTKAIIPVHIFGQMCDMDEILSIAKKYDIPVIEDACQAIGAEYKGKKAGSIGTFGTYSFFPSKNLGCYGDGGMITTNDDQLAEEVRMLRAHGCKIKYRHEKIGHNSRLDEIQAAILNVKLKYLDSWTDLRRKNGNYYNEQLKELPVKPQGIDQNCKHVYHQYCIEVADSDTRDRLNKFLNDNNISTAIYYPIPVHLMDVYLDMGYGDQKYPVAEGVCSRTLALPMYPELQKEEQDYIISKIREFFK